MIQIYKPSNTNYTSNGDMTLQPSEAEIQAKLNGTWQAELSHPIDAEGRWKYIEDQAVLKMPSFNGEQLFRIVKKSKSDSGITMIAEPIFLDAKGDCYLKDIRPTNVNGQQALNQMLAPNKKYSGKSDIALKTTAYYQDKNLIQALNGEEDNSFINRWGGEIIYDNFQVIVNKRAGGDYGVQILYGKNIEKDGIKEEVDFSDVVTRIYPKAFNGYSLSGNGYVDSPVIGSYPTVKSSTMTFEDVKMREDAREEDEANGIIVCDTQADLDAALKKKCQEQYDNGIDKPTVTISVNIVALQNTEEYQDYKVLEEVSLGDTVHCKSSNLGIVTDARVTEIKYDSISKKVSSVKIGDVAADYFDSLSDSAVRVDIAIRPDGTVIGQQIQGLIDMAAAQMKLQNTVAKRVNVRAVLLEDTDPGSPLYGAMCWGTQGFQIANERTEDGKDWKWSTFGNANGFFADLIVAGTMLADRIRGGELLSQNYVDGENGFKLDLNNGIIEAVQLLIKTAAQGRMERGFLFEDGALKILGTDGEVVASLHCTWSYPDGPDGVPSGWTGRVAFTSGEPVDNYGNGFWVSNRGNRWCGASANGIEFDAGQMDMILDKLLMNNNETKSGRIEFSDGTYIDIVNGVVIGGNSKAGAF